MSEKLTKKFAEDIMRTNGECRGIHLRNDAEYVLIKKGEQGLKIVEKEIQRLGFSIKYKEIKNMEFYPAGLRILSLLAIKKVFNWDDEEIREMCGFAAKVSFIVKLYVKFFYSVSKILEKAASMWQEHWTQGKLNVVDYNEEKKYILLKLENFDTHPIYCRCLEGYLRDLTKMVTKAENPECKEIKPSSEGKKSYEFLIKY